MLVVSENGEVGDDLLDAETDQQPVQDQVRRDRSLSTHFTILAEICHFSHFNYKQKKVAVQVLLITGCHEKLTVNSVSSLLA